MRYVSRVPGSRALQRIRREAIHVGYGAAGAVVVVAAFLLTPFALVGAMVARRLRGQR